MLVRKHLYTFVACILFLVLLSVMPIANSAIFYRYTDIQILQIYVDIYIKIYVDIFYSSTHNFSNLSMPFYMTFKLSVSRGIYYRKFYGRLGKI